MSTDLFTGVTSATNVLTASTKVIDNTVDFFNLEDGELYQVCLNSWKNLGLVLDKGQYIKHAEPSDYFDRLLTSSYMVYTTNYMDDDKALTTFDGMLDGELTFYIDHDRWMKSGYSNGTVIHPEYGVVTMSDRVYYDGKSRMLHQTYTGTTACYRYLRAYLHGRRFAIRMRREGFVYTGRLKINSVEQDPSGSYSKIVIGYMLDPSPVDAADLGLKYVVNWYDYDGTLIYTELVPVGSTPTVPEIPERDPDDPDNPGTDPTASWDDPSDPTDPTKPVEGNEDHQVSSGKLIVDCGGLYTYESTGRTGNTYEYHYGWVQSPATGKTQHAMLLRGISGQNIFEYCTDYDQDAWHPNHSLGYGVQKVFIDSNLQAATWVLACPKAYTEGNYSSTIEGKYTKGTTKLYLDYVNALVFYNNAAPEPTSLVISMFDIYEYDAETETLTIW